MICNKKEQLEELRVTSLSISIIFLALIILGAIISLSLVVIIGNKLPEFIIPLLTIITVICFFGFVMGCLIFDKCNTELINLKN